MTSVAAVLKCLVLILFVSSSAWATPFIPASDDEVLERLPDRSAVEYRDLKRLKDEAAAAPASFEAAAALADAYYRISRREGDPRFLGYAQAALTKWWKDADAPTPVLVMRAVILQSIHQFESAIADLDKTIAADPGNARASLVRATVQTVRGNYDEARIDCGRLRGLTQDLYVLVCLSEIDALTGKAEQAKTAFRYARANVPDTSLEAVGWIESLLGELLQRQGDAEAELHFKAALAADPRDLYTLGAYSDWLLDRGRPADVIPLVENEQRVDALLLRLALAQRALKQPEAEATVATLRARFDASRARGDTVHRREEARFQLALNNDAKTALGLAKENWQVQHEPADLRVLAEAAKATNDTEAIAIVRQWLAKTGLEYAAVAGLVK